jgi:hypothetical protein
MILFESPLEALKLAVDMLNSCTDDEFDAENWALVNELTAYCTEHPGGDTTYRGMVVPPPGPDHPINTTISPFPTRKTS